MTQESSDTVTPELRARVGEYAEALRRKRRLEKALKRAEKAIADAEWQLIRAFGPGTLGSVEHEGRIFRIAFDYIMVEPLEWHPSEAHA